MADDKTIYKHENLKIFPIENASLYKIAFENGGRIPDEVSGKYTSLAAAKKSLNLYASKQSIPKRAYRKRK